MDTILEGNKAKAAGLLHRAAFFSYESLCDIFTNPELNIHVQPKIDSDSCRLDVSFDQKGNIIFNSQQLVEVGNFGEQKTSYLSVHTKYENEHQTITVEKVV